MALEEDKLQLLRDILLIDDREIADAITQRLQLITETIEKQEMLSEKVDPIIDQKLKSFISEIPLTLGPTITQTLKEQIANSRDEVVEVLYPIMGKMIKKYIQNEMKMLSEEINRKVNKTFSMASLKRKFRSRFTGVKESDILITDCNKLIVNEVFVIENGSGLLLGNYSTTKTVDKDMISGMLTAIKSFVEDAFEGGGQNLENINYELYNIHIQNFHTYYIAAVCTGNYTRILKNKLENNLFQLSENITSKVGVFNNSEINSILKNFFDKWEFTNS